MAIVPFKLCFCAPDNDKTAEFSCCDSHKVRKKQHTSQNEHSCTKVTTKDLVISFWRLMYLRRCLFPL